MKNLFAILTVAILACSFSQDAYGLADFKKVWTKKYIDTHKSEDFQKIAKKASCNVCHVKGAKKNYQNAYGKAINKLIEGDANKRKKQGSEEKAKVLKEFEEALEKVAKMKTGKDGKGPTYGELIKEGKLPVDMDTAKKKYEEEKAKKEAEG